MKEESDKIRPAHYGGKDDPYQAVIVNRKWNLNFNLGNVLKYIQRHGKKAGEDPLDDIRKALWYLQYEYDWLVAEREAAIASEQKDSGQKTAERPREAPEEFNPC